MPIGAGFAPAGSSAAGYGVPDAAPIPGIAPLPDTKTGLSQTGRFIDPVTKDYAFGPDGRLYGMATVPQLVQLAITTTRGSSAVPDLGEEFTKIQEKGPAFPRQLASSVGNCLSDLVKRKLVQVVSVVATEPSARGNPDAGIATLKWLDMTTGREMDTTVGQ